MRTHHPVRDLLLEKTFSGRKVRSYYVRAMIMVVARQTTKLSLSISKYRKELRLIQSKPIDGPYVDQTSQRYSECRVYWTQCKPFWFSSSFLRPVWEAAELWRTVSCVLHLNSFLVNQLSTNQSRLIRNISDLIAYQELQIPTILWTVNVFPLAAIVLVGDGKMIIVWQNIVMILARYFALILNNFVMTCSISFLQTLLDLWFVFIRTLDDQLKHD